METKSKHGYEIYLADGERYKYDRFYCKDDAEALEDIREILKEGRALEVHNLYETFYGCSWGSWLMKGTEDLATSKVLSTWHAWGNCPPYPDVILLTPIQK